MGHNNLSKEGVEMMIGHDGAVVRFTLVKHEMQVENLAQ